ncbi:helix-turn-helix domain-containing protein [Aquimarina addita]|uniref:Helix-turn-helix domain-containing protein n=1 Tax=Aquimarina addita TaxID=870485 RepID=A0ABP7XFV8_9FLAO
MYQKIKPAAEVYHIIDSFWTFSNNEVFENFKLLPDTCTDLIFDLTHDQGFISGVMTNFQHRELPAKSDLLGIRFKTENFGSLSKIPLNEIKNSRVEWSQIFLAHNLDRLKQLSDLATIPAKISFLENFISITLRENYEKQDKMVLSVAENIRLLKGNMSIRNLATLNHISLRQLERRFKNYMGLTIKEFASIVRFSTTKKAIASFSETSLLSIAFDMGFYDHSHMNYEFNRITGENPGFFR